MGVRMKKKGIIETQKFIVDYLINEKKVSILDIEKQLKDQLYEKQDIDYMFASVLADLLFMSKYSGKYKKYNPYCIDILYYLGNSIINDPYTSIPEAFGEKGSK